MNEPTRVDEQADSDVIIGANVQVHVGFRLPRRPSALASDAISLDLQTVSHSSRAWRRFHVRSDDLDRRPKSTPPNRTRKLCNLKTQLTPILARSYSKSWKH
jgi:hypothetical protein